jgi:uncharacterized protein (TIGR03437 family)
VRTRNWLTIAGFMLSCASTIAAQTVPNWTHDSPAISPMARDSHAMAYDSAHSQTVLFGGEFFQTTSRPTTYVFFSDTWLWDGANWTQESPQTSPPQRYGHAMAYDSAHGQTVLFGGTNFNHTASFIEYNDTWLWDGSKWTLEVLQTSPTARDAFAMAYDSAHGQVVLFGGEDKNGNLLDDTWLWNGSNWTQIFPTAKPPAVLGPAMAYDSAHGQIVLFGGQDTNNNYLNETWVWNGANWTLESPKVSPSARCCHAMAYDSAHDQVVLFGGTNAPAPNYNQLYDTWVWDGSNWNQESQLISPDGRFNHAMAYDVAHDQVVLFGGLVADIVTPGPPPDANDTWTWFGGAAPPPAGPTITGVVSASAFGEFPSVAPGSWVEIYGSNLAPDTRSWAGSDFTGNNAPTSLDGVSVSIGGQAAFVDYISGGQVNAQLPSNIATGGMLQLTVTNGSTTSSAYNINVNATEAGLLAPSAFKIGGNQYVVALHSDGSYVLPAGAIAGVNSSPAQPGEEVVMYGVGFGPVTPDIPAGEIVTQSNQLALPFQLMFGQTPAQLEYDGLSPNYVGLYQFNVIVPSLPDNDLVPLTFNLGGVTGSQTFYTAVHQ